MEIRETLSQHTYSRLRIDPQTATRTKWLAPARRRGRSAFAWDEGMRGLGATGDEGHGELQMDGNIVYVFDRKTSTTKSEVLAHLERLGVKYEFRDIEAYPQYREQMDRVWAESPEGKRPEDLDPSVHWGHTEPVVWVMGHTMSGYSPQVLETLIHMAGTGAPRLQTTLIRYGALALGAAALGVVGYLFLRRNR